MHLSAPTVRTVYKYIFTDQRFLTNEYVLSVVHFFFLNIKQVSYLLADSTHACSFGCIEQVHTRGEYSG